MASPTLHYTSYLTLRLFLAWIPHTSLNLKSGKDSNIRQAALGMGEETGNGCCFCMAGLYQRLRSYCRVPCPLLGYVEDECLGTKRSRLVVSQH